MTLYLALAWLIGLYFAITSQAVILYLAASVLSPFLFIGLVFKILVRLGRNPPPGSKP